MMDTDPVPVFTDSLARVVMREIPQTRGIEALRRLSGGASQETWSFLAVQPKGLLPLILRRAPGGEESPADSRKLTLEKEGRLVEAVRHAGVPVPDVRYILQPEEGAGSGFIMDFVEGETIARKILRDPAFAAIRPELAGQCGTIMAHLHASEQATLPELATSHACSEIDRYEELYRAHDHPHPVFEIALRWLREHLPPPDRTTLVHGDFRNGNLIIGAEGVRAVLDWELAHFGDPMEDLGWICVNSWRFGQIDQPVGGFGTREDLFAAYEAAGGPPVDRERVRFWEVLGTLKWGVMCTMMYETFRSGSERSVERAAIGRRASETEIDLLHLLAPIRPAF